jgi:hypothetical protein
MKALPNSVYITNFVAEYSFLPRGGGVPQMEINMYMGISSTSQKRKKSKRSRDMKTPRIPVSRIKSQAKYSFVLRLIFHETKTATNPRKVVSITMGKLRPSTPR